jgi:crotonobetainyl-CoA:carnitine CoA-transferase CaiB-like acyl-CoA transferase
MAGAGIGRDLASFGADVLNVWHPDDSEVEAIYWDTQVGMRSAYLSDSGGDRGNLDELLRALIHAQVLLHGAEGPWATRPGFDEVGTCVSGIFALGGTLEEPRQPPMLPIVDNIVGWFGTVGAFRHHHSGEHCGTLGHPARAVHREDPTLHLPGNDRSDRILFTFRRDSPPPCRIRWAPISRNGPDRAQ